MIRLVEDLGRQLSLGKQTDLILLDFSNFNFNEDTCPNPLGRHHRQGFKIMYVRCQTVQIR